MRLLFYRMVIIRASNLVLKKTMMIKNLTDEPLDEPPSKLSEALRRYDIQESDFQVYQHGETRYLDDMF